MIFFGDPVTFRSVLAIIVGFFAGVVYAVAKNNQKKVENRTQADAILPLTPVSETLGYVKRHLTCISTVVVHERFHIPAMTKCSPKAHSAVWVWLIVTPMQLRS